MDKAAFLAQDDVKGFVSWLVEELPKISVHLNFKSSKFVPGGIDQHCVGVDSVLNEYRWSTEWQEPVTAVAISSKNWGTTKNSLTLLRNGLRNAMNAGNHDLTESYCLQILKWGGVSCARGFIRSQTRSGTLISYLLGMESHLMLTDTNRLGDLNSNTVFQYDAGMTKIHALLDSTGSPIYDSRVGAAIAMLYAIYCDRESKKHSPLLSFPVGSARGKQIRNPGNLGLGYPPSPSFYTPSVSKHFWAQSQLKLGWILRQVILDSNPSWDEIKHKNEVVDRCHELEASLFMLGYDLSCFLHCSCGAGTAMGEAASEGVSSHAAGEIGVAVMEREFTYVPTGFSMNTIIPLFREYAKFCEFENLSKVGFIEWQINKNINPNTARANSFPLTDQEFDFFNRTKVELVVILDGGLAALKKVMDGRFPSLDERDMVCLTDCYIEGTLKRKHNQPSEIVESIMKSGFARTCNSANTLRNVGRSVGRFFALLDHDGNPTEEFDDFFRKLGFTDEVL